MKLTFARLGAYIQKHEANIHVLGRKTRYMIPDVMGKGMHIMMTAKPLMGEGDDVDNMDIDEDGELPDELEVDDDGSLDM